MTTSEMLSNNIGAQLHFVQQREGSSRKDIVLLYAQIKSWKSFPLQEIPRRTMCDESNQLVIIEHKDKEKRKHEDETK